eukprot:TRINITY_DN49346_c0_g2_i3.p4 TRINITY_DN49346_c0_g2~~TRINITY_DN49346_c0_g2_i3.p4  ORF type:complete len:122 (+),score=6.74 TRINITY_DN49346_c0_g2_i3:473-838(+)
MSKIYVTRTIYLQFGTTLEVFVMLREKQNEMCKERSDLYSKEMKTVFVYDNLKGMQYSRFCIQQVRIVDTGSDYMMVLVIVLFVRQIVWIPIFDGCCAADILPTFFLTSKNYENFMSTWKL